MNTHDGKQTKVSIASLNQENRLNQGMTRPQKTTKGQQRTKKDTKGVKMKNKRIHQ